MRFYVSGEVLNDLSGVIKDFRESAAGFSKLLTDFSRSFTGTFENIKDFREFITGFCKFVTGFCKFVTGFCKFVTGDIYSILGFSKFLTELSKPVHGHINSIQDFIKYFREQEIFMEKCSRNISRIGNICSGGMDLCFRILKSIRGNMKDNLHHGKNIFRMCRIPRAPPEFIY